MRDTIEVPCPVCEAPITLAVNITEDDDGLSPRDARRIAPYAPRRWRSVEVEDTIPTVCEHVSPDEFEAFDDYTPAFAFTQRERDALQRSIEDATDALARDSNEG